MKFKAKLNLKFYIIAVLLLGIVVFGWYAGVYFLNVNEILMEDNTPMDAQTKMIFTVVVSIIVSSWTLSLLTVIRQIILGYAFCIDQNGIHSTATAVNILAFIFVIPIKTIPYSAIERVSEENGMLTVHFDKNKIEMLPFLRLFVRKRFHFFNGFTTEQKETIKYELSRYIKV